MPKTLNSIIRRKEAERISEENKRIAIRIASRSPVLSSKLFKKEYEMMEKYKGILRKYSLISQKRTGSTKKLETFEKIGKQIFALKENAEIVKGDEGTSKGLKSS
jgi:hypothetical protein